MAVRVRAPRAPRTQDNGKRNLPATDLNKGISVPGTGAGVNSPISAPSAGGGLTAQQQAFIANFRAGDPSTVTQPAQRSTPQITSVRPPVSAPGGFVSEEAEDVFESRQPRQPFTRGNPLRPPDPQTRLEALVAESTALTSANNPYQQPGRPDYDPTTQIPGTLEEVASAQAFLRETQGQVKQIVESTDGFGNTTLVDAFTGLPVTPDDLAFLEWRENLKNEIGNVRNNNDAVVREQTQATIDNAQSTFEAFLDEQEKSALEGAQTDEEIKLINAEYDRRREEVQERGIEDRITAQFKAEFDQKLTERQAEIDLALDNNRFNFNAGQNELDRLLRAGELELAVSAQSQLESFQSATLDLQNRQFQLDIFTQLSQSPEILHFLGQQPGMLKQFGDLMGDGGAALGRIFERLDERPTTNLQEFRRLSEEDQGIESFRLAAKTGTRDVQGLLQREAPQGGIGVDPTQQVRQRFGRR